MTRARDVANVLTAANVLATDTETAAAISTHAAAADPHTGYLKESEFNSSGKNFLINGGFDIWQRGTSGTFTNSPTWTPDRWWGCVSGGAPTCTISRQTADTIGFNYGARFGRNSGQTGVGTVYLGQTLETSESKLLAGKTITVSFYAKSGANAPTPLYVGVYTGTGTDQSTNTLFNGGGWTSTGQVNNGVTVTSTMTRYNVQMAISSNVTQVTLYFAYTSSGTAGANEWFQIEGVQLEIGSTPTLFSRAGGNIQGELAACQRYYIRYNGGATNAILGGFGGWITTTIFRPVLQLPVPMRIAPSSVDYSSVAVREYQSASAINATAVSIDQTSPQQVSLNLTTTARTIGYIGFIQVDNANVNGYIGLSAEL